MESKYSDIFSGVKIHLLGVPSLKKHLTSFYLRQQTNAECIMSDDYASLHRDAQGSSHSKSIVLWDVVSMHPRGYKKEEIIESLGRGDLLSNYSVALFDLGPQFKLESLALGLGVKGFFYRGDSPQQLVRGLTHICQGNVWVSPKVIQDSLFGSSKSKQRSVSISSLTKREEDVLRLITHGYRNSEIADQLAISTNTVKAHLYQAFKKIKVSSRMMASQWAEHNLQKV